MSKETSEWLNQNILIGFTDKRGHAWHYKASAQGDEPNHYSGAVPVADVMRRLFHWTANEAPVYVLLPATMEDATTVDADGNPAKFVRVDDRKAIYRDDSEAVMGLFKSGYAAHQYPEWLVGNVANILRTGELEIGTAGLLKNGAQAFVSVEVPENLTTPEGVEYRPNLVACTSLDGTLATTYKRTVTLPVCDNTLAAGLAESGMVYKVKHSKYSNLKLEDAAAALEIVGDIADAFASEVQELTQWEISTEDFDKFLAEIVPIDETNKRSVTVGDAKREAIHNLYHYDLRAAPWKGTAFGVLQATNTYNHHHLATRGDTVRAERNMSEVLTDKMQGRDADALKLLAKVTGRELVSAN